MTSNAATVRVGQVWADNDWRSRGRTVMVMEIDDSHAVCVVAWPGHKTPRRTRIRLSRFRPNSTGYFLISDMPGTFDA